jgi:hypothetical protein
MKILRRQFWSLNHHDWEEIWSWAVWDLDRMAADGKVAPNGDLQKLLLRLTRNRASAYLKSKIRYYARLTRLFADAVDRCDKKDGMFVLLEAVESHAAKLDETERLLIFNAVKLLTRCGAKKIDQLPVLTLAAMVNGKANPQISLEQADEILWEQWEDLRVFLKGEGFNREP